jgi:succinate dehydrogenase flavin-adding protein (antitoxin of CptAB toxin-antitoxin module)
LTKNVPILGNFLYKLIWSPWRGSRQKWMTFCATKWEKKSDESSHHFLQLVEIKKYY